MLISRAFHRDPSQSPASSMTVRRPDTVNIVPHARCDDAHARSNGRSLSRMVPPSLRPPTPVPHRQNRARVASRNDAHPSPEHLISSDPPSKGPYRSLLAQRAHRVRHLVDDSRSQSGARCKPKPRLRGVWNMVHGAWWIPRPMAQHAIPWKAYDNANLALEARSSAAARHGFAFGCAPHLIRISAGVCKR